MSRSGAPSDSSQLESAGPRRVFVLGGGLAVSSLTLMVILTGLASATNYASNIVFGRLMVPASYGDLTAILSLVVVLTVPAGAAQTIGAERIAALVSRGDEERARYLLRHGLAHVAVIAAITGVLAVAAAPLIESALDLRTLGTALSLAPLLMISFFIPVAWGLLQGFERFVALGLLMFVAALLRIGLGAPWAALDGGAGGVAIGQALGNAAALAIVAWLLREHLIGPGTGAATSGMRRKPDSRSLSATWAFIAFALLSNLDVLMAKLLLSPNESGEYAALATIGKIVIFLPAAIAVVMVPSVARASAAASSTAKVLRSAGPLVLASTLLATIPIVIFPDQTIDLMFGSEYVGAAGGVRAIAIAGAGLSVLYLLVVYTVAIQDPRWVFVLTGAVLLQVGAIALRHSNPTDIATAQAAVVLFTLIVNEILFHPILRTGRGALTARLDRGSP